MSIFRDDHARIAAQDARMGKWWLRIGFFIIFTILIDVFLLIFNLKLRGLDLLFSIPSLVIVFPTFLGFVVCSSWLRSLRNRVLSVHESILEVMNDEQVRLDEDSWKKKFSMVLDSIFRVRVEIERQSHNARFTFVPQVFFQLAAAIVGVLIGDVQGSDLELLLVFMGLVQFVIVLVMLWEAGGVTLVTKKLISAIVNNENEYARKKAMQFGSETLQLLIATKENDILVLGNLKMEREMVVQLSYIALSFVVFVGRYDI